LKRVAPNPVRACSRVAKTFLRRRQKLPTAPIDPDRNSTNLSTILPIETQSVIAEPTMKSSKPILAVVLGSALAFGALADDRHREFEVEGVVESVDVSQGMLVVAGVTIYTNDRTDYDDDYRRLEDIKVGDRVEVDYISRDGRNIATEIERDD
jgi:hypothetical protein